MSDFDDNEKFETEEDARSAEDVNASENPGQQETVVLSSEQTPEQPTAGQNEGFPYGQTPNVNPTPEEQRGPDRPAQGYPYGAASGSYPYNQQQPRTSGSYRSQTPPPYGYGQRGNANPYSAGDRRYPYSNPSDPYPYAGQNPNGGSAPYAPAGERAAVKQREGSAGKIIAIICAVVLGILVLVLGGIIIMGGRRPAESPSTPAVTQDSGKSEETTVNNNVGEVETAPTPDKESSAVKVGDELTAQEIFKKIEASSVGVIVYEKLSSSNSSPFGGSFGFSPDFGFGGDESEEAGEGTGVLIKEDNNGKYTYVLTCAHVVEDADSVIVQLSDNTEYEAEIVGSDRRTDIAVLRIEASGLTLAEVGDSDAVSVGDTVYAIGNPGGTSFAGSFTNGMVSALDRPISSSSGYTMQCIQHTAAINPGNSGGALVNTYGQLIGINSSKIVSEDYEGMGFAVPSSVFVDVANNIMANGFVANRAKLGITYVAASSYSSYQMYVTLKDLPAGSLVIYSIADDSDLQNYDVKRGDMIIAVNGEDLDDAATLASVVENSGVGDKLTLTIARIGDNYELNTFDVTVKLVEDRG